MNDPRRHHHAAFRLLALLAGCFSGFAMTASAAPNTTTTATTRTLLFLDDQRLNQRDNVERRLGTPELIPESVFVDPAVNTAWGYPGVFHDPVSGKWRLLYLGWTGPELGKRFPLLAESDDGLHWSPRDTTRELDLPDRRFPHQVLPLDQFAEWPACYVDPYAPPAERLKGLVIYHTDPFHIATALWVSPDGLHWTRKPGIEWQNPGADPGTAVFWNAVRQSYVFTSRPDWTDRRIALFETRDWQHFTTPELALQTDPLDSPLTQLYGMPVFPYEGYYIGLLWLFHTVPQVSGSSPHKSFGGHVDCQLTYSLNGWHFQRSLRTPFMPNGPTGALDAGCLYPSTLIEHDDRWLWIYSSVSRREHADIPLGEGAIATYRLRRDGFVFLESLNGPGTVGTVTLAWHSGEPALNVLAPEGEVRVQVTDPEGHPLPGYTFADCLPFTGDAIAWHPTWRTSSSQNANSQNVASQKSVTSQSVDSKNLNLQSVGSQNAGSQSVDSQNVDSQNMASQPPGSLNTGSQSAASQSAGSQSHGLVALAPRPLRLEIQLRSARLYALRGHFTPLTAGEYWRLTHQSLPPTNTPGF
jgi:hypothetical protein